MEDIDTLRTEIQQYIDKRIKEANCDVNLIAALQALDVQKKREKLYIEALDNLVDSLIKAKEIKEMLSICDKHPKLGPCIRLKPLLKKRQYQLSKLI